MGENKWFPYQAFDFASAWLAVRKKDPRKPFSNQDMEVAAVVNDRKRAEEIAKERNKGESQ